MCVLHKIFSYGSKVNLTTPRGYSFSNVFSQNNIIKNTTVKGCITRF